jgi:predicted N-acyltransferase
MDKDSNQISSMEIKFSNDIENLKQNSVDYMLRLHPKFYRESLKFNDWQSSMEFLTDNKDLVFDFWRRHDD